MLPQCVVGMEACLTAHFVSRALRQIGHKPRIIPAIYVKRSAWLTNAAPRMHRNKLATALANKLARIAQHVLSSGKSFDTHRSEIAPFNNNLKTNSRLRHAWNGLIDAP